jgi:hypothetical protein
MTVETDYDFVVKFRGEIFGGTFSLNIDDVADLEDLEVLTNRLKPPTTKTKCGEFLRDLDRIRHNPTEEFDTTGGNRGMVWENLGKTPDHYEIVGKIIDLLRENGVEIDSPYDLENFCYDYMRSHSDIIESGRFKDVH